MTSLDPGSSAPRFPEQQRHSDPAQFARALVEYCLPEGMRAAGDGLLASDCDLSHLHERFKVARTEVLAQPASRKQSLYPHLAQALAERLPNKVKDRCEAQVLHELVTILGDGYQLVQHLEPSLRRLVDASIEKGVKAEHRLAPLIELLSKFVPRDAAPEVAALAQAEIVSDLPRLSPKEEAQVAEVSAPEIAAQDAASEVLSEGDALDPQGQAYFDHFEALQLNLCLPGLGSLYAKPAEFVKQIGALFEFAAAHESEEARLTYNNVADQLGLFLLENSEPVPFGELALLSWEALRCKPDSFLGSKGVGFLLEGRVRQALENFAQGKATADTCIVLVNTCMHLLHAYSESHAATLQRMVYSTGGVVGRLAESALQADIPAQQLHDLLDFFPHAIDPERPLVAELLLQRAQKLLMSDSVDQVTFELPQLQRLFSRVLGEDLCKQHFASDELRAIAEAWQDRAAQRARRDFNLSRLAAEDTIAADGVAALSRVSEELAAVSELRARFPMRQNRVRLSAKGVAFEISMASEHAQEADAMDAGLEQDSAQSENEIELAVAPARGIELVIDTEADEILNVRAAFFQKLRGKSHEPLGGKSYEPQSPMLQAAGLFVACSANLETLEDLEAESPREIGNARRFGYAALLLAPQLAAVRSFYPSIEVTNRILELLELRDPARAGPDEDFLIRS